MNACPGYHDHPDHFPGARSLPRGRPAADPGQAPLALFLLDSDRQIRGGLLGESGWGWLHIYFLWVAEPFQRSAYGGALLARRKPKRAVVAVGAFTWIATMFRLRISTSAVATRSSGPWRTIPRVTEGIFSGRSWGTRRAESTDGEGRRNPPRAPSRARGVARPRRSTQIGAGPRRIHRPGNEGGMPAEKKPLWTCPRCGHRFVTRNMWHSCRRVPLSRHFAGKSPELRRTFRRLAALVRACGPEGRAPLSRFP